MTIDDAHDMSAALCIYLGFGTSSFPAPLASRLESAFSKPVAARLGTQVREILDAALRIEIDWGEHSLESAGRFVGDALRRRHPELDARAIQAIVGYITYQWR